MTRAEFEKLIDCYMGLFPQTRDWVNKLDQPAAMLDGWFESLKNTRVIHAMTAIERILDGSLAPIHAYDRDNAALIIRAYAGRIADDERKRQATMRTESERQQDVAEYHGRTNRPKYFPAGKLFRRAAAVWADEEKIGTSPAEIVDKVSQAVDELLDELCPEQDTDDPGVQRGRPPCEYCGNGGCVPIWHPKAVVAMRTGVFTRKHRLSCAVACTCRYGDSLHEPNGKYKSLPRYSEYHHLRILHGAIGEADVERLRQWVDDGPDITKHNKYHSEFADWS